MDWALGTARELLNSYQVNKKREYSENYVWSCLLAMSLVESLYLFTLMFDRVECSPWNVELLSIDNSTILYANEPVDFQLNQDFVNLNCENEIKRKSVFATLFAFGGIVVTIFFIATNSSYVSHIRALSRSVLTQTDAKSVERTNKRVLAGIRNYLYFKAFCIIAYVGGIAARWIILQFLSNQHSVEGNASFFFFTCGNSDEHEWQQIRTLYRCVFSHIRFASLVTSSVTVMRVLTLLSIFISIYYIYKYRESREWLRDVSVHEPVKAQPEGTLGMISTMLESTFGAPAAGGGDATRGAAAGGGGGTSPEFSALAGMLLPIVMQQTAKHARSASISTTPGAAGGAPAGEPIHMRDILNLILSPGSIELMRPLLQKLFKAGVFKVLDAVVDSLDDDNPELGEILTALMHEDHVEGIIGQAVALGNDVLIRELRELLTSDVVEDIVDFTHHGVRRFRDGMQSFEDGVSSRLEDSLRRRVVYRGRSQVDGPDDGGVGGSGVGNKGKGRVSWGGDEESTFSSSRDLHPVGRRRRRHSLSSSFGSSGNYGGGGGGGGDGGGGGVGGGGTNDARVEVATAAVVLSTTVTRTADRDDEDDEDHWFDDDDL